MKINKIFKIGERVIIKNSYGIQYNEKKAIYKKGKLTGIIRAIYKNHVYKIQLDPTNYVYLTEENLMKEEMIQPFTITIND